MRSIYIILLFFSTVASAQYSVGLFVEPSANINRFSHPEHPDYDSLSPLLNNDLSLNLGLDIGIQFDRFTALHFKPGYYQYNSLLVREGLQLFDVVHPQLGKLMDHSQASNKMAYMRHRFKYLGLQIEYKGSLSPTRRKLAVDINGGFGLGYFYLLTHDLRVRTEGFAIDGKFKHTIKEDLYFEGRKHNVNFYAFFETVYEPEPPWNLFAQIHVKVPVMSTSSNDPKIYTFGPALCLGVRKDI